MTANYQRPIVVRNPKKKMEYSVNQRHGCHDTLAEGNGGPRGKLHAHMIDGTPDVAG